MLEPAVLAVVEHEQRYAGEIAETLRIRTTDECRHALEADRRREQR